MTHFLRPWLVSAWVPALAAAFAAAAMGDTGIAAEKPRILLLTGANNHDWKATTPELVRIFETGGRFEVEVIVSPPADAGPDAHAAFQPDFAAADAVLLHWNSYGAKSKPATAWMDGLIRYVEAGGGLYVFHAAGFDHHPGFASVAGLVWQNAASGDAIHIGSDGGQIRIPKGEGRDSGHGPRAEHVQTVQAPGHPVTAGLPKQWKHALDEAWFSQRGPARDMEILVTTRPPETGLDEPMVWTRTHGKGRVFVNRLGHDAQAMNCTGFRALSLRGLEWAATGKVTLPLPENLPGPDAVRLAEE